MAVIRFLMKGEGEEYEAAIKAVEAEVEKLDKLSTPPGKLSLGPNVEAAEAACDAYLKTSGSAEEQDILDELSDLIDSARETEDQATRTELYEQAMGFVLDLAVELPVYQRDVLYAYNAKVIDSDSMPTDVNPYSSPLDRIWELEYAN
jgi:hypothetical protein